MPTSGTCLVPKAGLILPRIRARASCASTFGLRSPAISAAIIARPDFPKMSLATTGSFDARVLQQLLRAVLLRRPCPGQVRPVAGDITEPADLRRGTKLGRIICPLSDLSVLRAGSTRVRDVMRGVPQNPAGLGTMRHPCRDGLLACNGHDSFSPP